MVSIRILGIGDLHDVSYDHTEVVIPLITSDFDNTTHTSGHCMYSFSVYSSDTFTHNANNKVAVQTAVALAAIFVLVALLFFAYDNIVRRRDMKAVNEAARSNVIISSLFPSQVRERLFEEKGDNTLTVPKSKLKSMMNSGNYTEAQTMGETAEDLIYTSKPIADLFPETTILFADIAGFTAWSSVREPSQVFVLLETLYRAFDDIANRRRVFKVETIGDCYVAVAGLPEPRKDHAVAMARFSRDCIYRMRSLCKQLEVTLGPDTGDLAMRMGIHSGPVTAGVLRGERSRFQLFGDTMNTAARMEHTGLRNKIQVSQDTADLLIVAGKASWLTKREDGKRNEREECPCTCFSHVLIIVISPCSAVLAKGKGEMQTHWLDIRGNASSVVDVTGKAGTSEKFGSSESDATSFDGKTLRLIEWNVDVLHRSLKEIVARRKACPLASSEHTSPKESRFTAKHGHNTLDEVMEVITLPNFKEAKYKEMPEDITLDSTVIDQLRQYIGSIATLYRSNPFHNFEHASHVAMSVVKLLSRIVAPHMEEDDDDLLLRREEDVDHGKHLASTLHDHTYGITSDPLTQFSCILSALIHDVDHAGVPNAQLVEENAKIAQQYKDKSVAEQNSVDLTWNLLMEEQFTELRRTIYETDEELKRFRQLVVNSVMATDIVDKTLKTLRNLRWDRAFSKETHPTDYHVTVNRKATIVIEHLIQASDVSHTMQHWHVYRKWNERFFLECYQAYSDGRSEKNPADGWYQGELGFFDFYIIPLAKKLKDCGVFGVSSDEYLNYAISKRKEWETRGQEVVSEMITMVNEKAVRRQNV